MDVNSVKNVNRELEKQETKMIKENKIRIKSEQLKYLKNKYLNEKQKVTMKTKKNQENYDSSIYYELD